MKTISYKTIVFLLLALLPAGIYAQPGEKTFVKAINQNGNQTVYFDIEGKLDVKTWPQQQLRLLMKVNLANGTSIMLKSLVQAGRYDIQSGELGKGFTIFAPQLEKEVRMRNGENLNETISFTLFVPVGVQVIPRNDFGKISFSPQ